MQGLHGGFKRFPRAQPHGPAQMAQLRRPFGNAVVSALGNAELRDKRADARPCGGALLPPGDAPHVPGRLAGRIESEIGQTRRKMPAPEKKSQTRVIVLAEEKGLPQFFEQRIFRHMVALNPSYFSPGFSRPI